MGWLEAFEHLPVTFPNAALNRTLIEDYNNSSAIRLGVEYTIPSDGWKLRAGFAGVASAAPPETVTPLFPEQDRKYWTAGSGMPSKKAWALDASYAHVGTPGARGRIVDRTSESQTAAQLNTGVYTCRPNFFVHAQSHLSSQETNGCHAEKHVRGALARAPRSRARVMATRKSSSRRQQSLFQSYVSLGQQHHRGLPVGRNQRFDAEAGYPSFSRIDGTRFAYPSLTMPGCPPPVNNLLTQTRVTPTGQPASTGSTCALRNPEVGRSVNVEQRRGPRHTRSDPTAAVGPQRECARRTIPGRRNNGPKGARRAANVRHDLGRQQRRPWSALSGLPNGALALAASYMPAARRFRRSLPTTPRRSTSWSLARLDSRAS